MAASDVFVIAVVEVIVDVVDVVEHMVASIEPILFSAKKKWMEPPCIPPSNHYNKVL